MKDNNFLSVSASGGGLSPLSLPSDQRSRPLALPQRVVDVGGSFSISGV